MALLQQNSEQMSSVCFSFSHVFQVLSPGYCLPDLWEDHRHQGLRSGCSAAGDVHGHGDCGPHHPWGHLSPLDLLSSDQEKPFLLFCWHIPSLDHCPGHRFQVENAETTFLSLHSLSDPLCHVFLFTNLPITKFSESTFHIFLTYIWKRQTLGIFGSFWKRLSFLMNVFAGRQLCWE